MPVRLVKLKWHVLICSYICRDYPYLFSPKFVDYYLPLARFPNTNDVRISVAMEVTCLSMSLSMVYCTAHDPPDIVFVDFFQLAPGEKYMPAMELPAGCGGCNTARPHCVQVKHLMRNNQQIGAI